MSRTYSIKNVVSYLALFILIVNLSCAPGLIPSKGPATKGDRKFPKVIKKERAKELISKVDDAVHIKAFNEGVALLRSGKREQIQEARRRFEDVLKERRGFWPASYNLAYIALQEKKLSLAEEYVTKALEFNREEKKIYYLLARVYLEKGEMKRAFDLYSEISENFNDTPLAYFQKGNILMHWTEYNNAIETYNRAGKPTKRYYKLTINKASCYLHLGEYENAVKTFRSVYDLNIRTPYILKQFAFSLRRAGALKEATDVYRELISLYPGETEAYKNAGIIYDLLLDIPEKAIPLYEKYIEGGGKERGSVANWLRIAREKTGNHTSGNRL